MDKIPELLEDFEVYKYSRAPIMAKLLGISLAVHMALMAFVVFVPTARNAFFIASLFSDTAFVERDYEQTKIGREDVTVLDFSRFTYPEGYFALTQDVVGTDINVIAGADEPRIIQLAGPQMAEPFPQSSPSPSPSDTTEAGSKDGVKDGTEVNANANTNANANANTNTDAGKTNKDGTGDGEKKTDDIAEADDIEKIEPNGKEFNKKPLKDFGAEIKTRVLAGKIDLKKPFEVEIKGELDAKGKLQNAKYTPKQGGDEIGEMGGRLVASLNDSNLLATVSEALNKNNDKPHKFVFNIKRDPTQLVVVFQIESESQDVASAAASGLGFILSLAANKRKEKDEGIVLEKTKATFDGKMVVINAVLPNDIADSMIDRQLTLAKQESGK